MKLQDNASEQKQLDSKYDAIKAQLERAEQELVTAQSQNEATRCVKEGLASDVQRLQERLKTAETLVDKMTLENA